MKKNTKKILIRRKKEEEDSKFLVGYDLLFNEKLLFYELFEITGYVKYYD